MKTYTEKFYILQEKDQKEWYWYNEYRSLKKARAGLRKARLLNETWGYECTFRIVKVIKTTEETVLT
jgi:hypothetical protein